MNQAEAVLRRIIRDEDLTPRQTIYFERLQAEEFEKELKTPIGKIKAMFAAGAILTDILLHHPEQVAEAAKKTGEMGDSILATLLGKESDEQH